MNFIAAHLASNDQVSGEDLTDACKAAGIKPHDDRAFGAVYRRLLRDKRIEKCATTIRKKGHGSVGCSVYRLVVSN